MRGSEGGGLRVSSGGGGAYPALAPDRTSPPDEEGRRAQTEIASLGIRDPPFTTSGYASLAWKDGRVEEGWAGVPKQVEEDRRILSDKVEA